MNHKTTLSLSAGVIIFFLLLGCTSKTGDKNNLIHFEVNASYPEKEIDLKEVADIEYLQLELNDDFLFAREPHLITPDKIILSQDGDILIFSRDGKPVLKFNRKGTGPEIGRASCRERV